MELRDSQKLKALFIPDFLPIFRKQLTSAKDLIRAARPESRVPPQLHTQRITSTRFLKGAIPTPETLFYVNYDLLENNGG